MTTKQRRYIYWCRECGVPLLQRECGKCGTKGIKTVSDLKPMFEEERAFYARETGWSNLLDFELPLLWMRYKTVWYNGQRLVRFSAGDGKPSVVKEYDHCLSELKPTLETLRRANAGTLKNLEKDAIDFIKQVVTEHPKRLPAVSFSGGKDSAVVSYLVRKALETNEVMHVFGDTTIEYPDTYAFTEEFRRASQIPAEMFLMPRAPLDWFEMCERLEPPSMILRWCCTVFKANPLGTVMNTLNDGGVLSFEGIRRCESVSRRNAEKIYKNKKISHQLSVRPIIDWKDLEVWIYLLVKGIPINPVYKKGLTRAGCLYCPYNSSFTDYLLSQIYPERIKEWRDFLVEHARQIGKKDAVEYVASGGWKLRAGGTERASQNTRLTRSGKPCEGDAEIRYQLTRAVTPTLYEMFKPLGILSPIFSPDLGYFAVLDYETQEELFRFLAPVGKSSLNIIVLRTKGQRLLLQQIERQIKKFQACVGCGGCVAVCPTGALSLNPSIRVDGETCIRCLKCSRFTKSGCIALNSLHTSGEIGRRKRMSVDFHHNFVLKRSTLSKALQAHISNSKITHDEQMSVIGVGYKAVAGYVGWLHHTGLRDSTARKVTELGELIHSFDPNMLDEGTKWVLHYQLCRPSEDESTLLWRHLIIKWLPKNERFSRRQFQQSASKILPRISDKKLRRCANIALRCYTEEEALGSLGILQFKNKLYQRGMPPEFPSPLLVAYVIYDHREKGLATSTTAIDTLLSEDGNVGKIFVLARDELMARLHQLEFKGLVRISRVADLDNIAYTFRGNSFDILRMYYEEKHR